MSFHWFKSIVFVVNIISIESICTLPSKKLVNVKIQIIDTIIEEKYLI